jgi:hypothetical protein
MPFDQWKQRDFIAPLGGAAARLRTTFARPRATRKPRIIKASRKASPSGDSCGCAMGAKFMAVGLLASAAWCGWQFYAGEISLGGAIVSVLAVSFVATSVGKIVGILRHRRQRGDDHGRHVAAASRQLHP